MMRNIAFYILVGLLNMVLYVGLLLDLSTSLFITGILWALKFLGVFPIEDKEKEAWKWGENG